jgi:hypothetical protein
MTEYINRVVHTACMGGDNAYQILAKMCEGQRQEGILRHRWKNDTGLKE